MPADPAPTNDPLVYVSYAWGDDSPEGKEREQVVDELCEALQTQDGIEVGRDKRRQAIGDSIEDFAAEIAKARIVLVVMSKKYLRSRHCMVEELLQKFRRCNWYRDEFKRETVLLLLDDAQADFAISEDLQKHWDAYLADEERKLMHDESRTGSPHAQTALEDVKELRRRMTDMLGALGDSIMPRGYKEISRNDFVEIRGLINKRLSEITSRPRFTSPNPAKAAQEGRKVFISYTRVDREWVDRLQRMMKPLLRATGQQIELWDDSQIEPGDAWRAAIETALAQAKVALLLVSADYLASEFVMNVEVPKLLAAAEAEGVRVLWVSLSPCLVEHTPIAEHQAVLPPDQYLVELDKPQQDRALEMITQRIMEALKDPEQQPQAPVAKQSPAKSIIRWRISCRIWREPLVDEVDLPMALIPSDASKQIGEYLLAVDPVNLRQWQKVAAMPRLELQLNTDPTEHGQPDQPVTGISREQALEFCRRLAVHTGRYYELPSEEQWEHACRAGSTTPYSWGEDWSSTLATAMANPWGLRRMHGSVWQWCRGGALRGGSWSDSVEHRQARSRATAKDPLHPSTVGLRVCCLPFGTPFFQLETSKSQWRPLITRAACAKVLHKPLNENEFIQLEKVLRRFHILGILQLRLFLSLLADRLGDGADDPKHPLALEPDQVRISSFLSSDSNEVFTLAASAWRERGWRRLAAQAKTQREVLAEVGMASGKRQRAFQQAVERAADAFPEPV